MRKRGREVSTLASWACHVLAARPGATSAGGCGIGPPTHGAAASAAYLRGLDFPDHITKLSSKTLARPQRLYGMCLALKPRRTELPVPRLFRKEGDLPKHLQPIDIYEMFYSKKRAR